MCRPITCARCQRPTWRGCGRHVEQVLGHVPESERCTCGSGAKAVAAAVKAPATAEAATPRRRWFGRRP